MKTLRLALYFVIGLLLGTLSAFSFAGTFQSYQGSAFRNINGTTYWKGDAGTLSASQATVLESFKIGGTYITVPTMGQITGAAMTAAMAGVRMTPGIAGAAVISWLASQGLQLADGQWKALSPPTSVTPATGIGVCQISASSPAKNLTGVSSSECMSAAVGATYPFGRTFTAPYMSDTFIRGTCSQDGTNWGCSVGTWSQQSTRPASCASGYVMSSDGTQCISTTYVPAGDSDWDKVNGIPKPDDVMRQLCQQLAQYNTTTPGCAVNQAKTQQASVPLSDWTLNPNTGQMTRQVAKWNPAPTVEDPFRGEVTINEETKTTTTTTNPTTGQPETTETTTSKDTTKDQPLCTLFPDIIACAKFGEASDPVKLDQTKQVSITPDSGFGASDGTCPQDLTYSLHMVNKQIRFSYQPVCTGLRTFRPVIIGMAWISGVLIFLGIARKAQS